MSLQTELKEIFQELLQSEDVSAWDDETQLLGAIAEFDSMALVTFLTTVEENYGIFIEDDEVSADIFATLATVTEFLQEKIS